MQTVDHSVFPPVPSGVPADQTARPDLRATQRVTVRPIVPRGPTLPSRESLQAAEDGGDAGAHPS